MRFLITFIVFMAESFTFAYGGTPDGSGAAMIHYKNINNESNYIRVSDGAAKRTLASGWSLAFVYIYGWCNTLANGSVILSPGQSETLYSGYYVHSGGTDVLYNYGGSSNVAYHKGSGGATNGNYIQLGQYGQAAFTIFYV